MSATWTLKRERGSQSETKTLNGWGITGAVMRLISVGLDTLILSQTKAINESDDFTNGDILRLYRDGVQTFMGRVQRPRSNGEAASEQRDTIIAGPWWWAEHETCVDNWRGNSGIELVPGLSKTRIFIDLDGQIQPIGGEVGRLVDNLIVPEPNGAGAPWTKGQIDSRGEPPPRELRNVTFAEAIQTVVATIPDIVAWFDYSTTNPTFNLRDPDMLTPIDIDASGAQVPTGAPRLEWQRDFGRHDDDEIPWVEIQIEAKEPKSVVVSGNEEARYQTNYRRYRFPQAATGRGGIPVLIEETDPLRAWDVLGFAQRAYEAFKGILWRGTFAMLGDDVNPRIRPGIRVNLTGSNPDWQDMNGLVQEVEHDIFAGRSTATFGPPMQMGPSDLVQKLINLSVKNATTNDKLRDQGNGYTAGFDSEKNEAADGGGTSSIKGLMAVQQPGGTFITQVLTFPRGTKVDNP